MDKNISIFYYHYIQPPPIEARIKGLYTTPKQLEWQIKQLLKHNFVFVRFQDIALHQYNPSKRNVVLTFDDGCESLYHNAFPILKKYGITGVVYVVAKCIGEKDIVWEQNENNIALNTLSRKQMLEMQEYGIEFGSHACNHVHLHQLSPTAIRQELFESKQILEDLLKKQIYSIAYPFGSYNANVLEAVAEAGYLFGVTTKMGDNTEQNVFELHRFSVKGYAWRHYFYFQKILGKLLKIYSLGGK